MKRGVVLFSIVAVLIVIAGCGVGTTTRDQGFSADFRTGTQGLYLSFETNMPPVNLYDDQPLEVVVRVENKGAYTVGGVGDALYLSGFDPTILTGISTYGNQIPELEGKTQYNSGMLDVVSFTSTIRDLRGKGIDKYPTRLVATACYGYQTIASANVCIDPDPFSLSVRQKPCVPMNVGLGGGQGAPVSVSNVELESNRGRTRFRLTINNVGGGDVFKPGADYLNKCSPYASTGLSYTEYDYVNLDDVSVAGQSITSSCKPSREIRLVGGRATIYCELSNIPSGTAFATPLTVRLSYGYRNWVSRDLTILASR